MQSIDAEAYTGPTPGGRTRGRRRRLKASSDGEEAPSSDETTQMGLYDFVGIFILWGVATSSVLLGQFQRQFMELPWIAKLLAALTRLQARLRRGRPTLNVDDELQGFYSLPSAFALAVIPTRVKLIQVSGEALSESALKKIGPDLVPRWHVR